MPFQIRMQSMQDSPKGSHGEHLLGISRSNDSVKHSVILLGLKKERFNNNRTLNVRPFF